jgi:hypothetical protein
VNREKALWTASKVFAPGFPRQSSDAERMQATRFNRADFCDALNEAMDNGMPGYYSVYSFPRGHSQDGNIPKVDCIFIDLDVEGDEYDPHSEEPQFDAWKRDISALLARARMIASAIIDGGQERHFRATLSGHKGLHLYLDFPTIAPTNGDFIQFKNGLKSYGEQVMSWLDSTAGGVNIDRWVDVDASDLGRLARHPNTIHHGAAYDEKRRWCVPVTISELADLRVEDYLELTKQPRWPEGYARNPSSTAGDKVVQEIRSASSSKSSGSGSSTYNRSIISDYEEESNDDLELADIDFLTSNYPCIAAFRDRDDAFDHGNASHIMEVNVIGKLVELKAPREVIHEFLSEIPGYQEGWTDEQIDTVIARQYQSFNCTEIASRAPQFCHGDSCAVYRRSDDVQK